MNSFHYFHFKNSLRSTKLHTPWATAPPKRTLFDSQLTIFISADTNTLKREIQAAYFSGTHNSNAIQDPPSFIKPILKEQAQDFTRAAGTSFTTNNSGHRSCFGAGGAVWAHTSADTKPPQQPSSSSQTGRKLIHQESWSLLQVSQAKPVQYQMRLAPEPMHGRETSVKGRRFTSGAGKHHSCSDTFQQKKEKKKRRKEPTQLSYNPPPPQSSSIMLIFSNRFL